MTSPAPADRLAGLPRLGVGLSYQGTLRRFVLENLDSFDFLEIIPDIFWTEANWIAAPVKDAVVGWIEKLATIVGGVAKKIMHDPGKFLTNLGEGIVQGLQLFMDEIGELKPALQAKLLHVLQDAEFTKLGSNKRIQVDVRIVAATNRDLEKMMTSGDFREDLYYRLAVVELHVPPLRERRDDIPMLVQHFTDIMTKREGMSPRSFETAAIEKLKSLSWPGNVRELRNTVERLLILAQGDEIDVADMDRLVGAASAGAALSAELLDAGSFSEFKERAERAFILAKLREFEWNVSETARSLDMPRSNLYKKIEKYELIRED